MRTSRGKDSFSILSRQLSIASSNYLQLQQLSLKEQEALMQTEMILHSEREAK